MKRLILYMFIFLFTFIANSRSTENHPDFDHLIPPEHHAGIHFDLLNSPLLTGIDTRLCCLHEPMNGGYFEKYRNTELCRLQEMRKLENSKPILEHESEFKDLNMLF